MEVVRLLDGDTLSVLRRALQPSVAVTSGLRKRGRIPLEAFVAEVYRVVCLRHNSDHGSIGRSQTETLHLVEKMCVLFDFVDVDSIGTVDWEHVTDFCVYMRGRDSGNQGLPEGDEHGAAKSGGDGRPDGLTSFVEKLGFTDRSSHCHEIRSMRFVKGLELLVVVEGTAILKIYSMGPHKIGQVEPAIAVRKLMIDSKCSARVSKGVFRGGGASAPREGAAANGKETEDKLAVLAVDFIGRDNQAAVSCADSYLTIWNLETFKLLRYVRLRDVQVGLRFCPYMDILTSWGVNEFNHEILVWDVDALTVLHVLDGHSEAVKDIYEVAPPSAAKSAQNLEKTWDPVLVTAGMDHKIVLWDLRVGKEGNRTPRKLLVLIGHYHGILSLAYSSEHDLILSAGFDFDANCWDRSSSHLQMKLVGHRLSLIGVVVVEHETQRAVTGDEGGSFRLWDIQRGHSDRGTCLQVFSLRNTRVSPRSMAVVWKEGLIVAGSKMHVFRAKKCPTVEVSPLGTWFSSYTGELCMVLREGVFFDAATGQITRRIFQQMPGRDITAFCMDARHKKAVVGDQQGGLRMYDGVTGRWTMSANPHRSEVSALIFIDEDNAFISAGWDGMIQVHDARVCSCSSTRSSSNKMKKKEGQLPDGHRHAFTLRSVVRAHDGDITVMAASARLGLVATASSDLTVRLWDYGLLRLEEVLVAHREDITSVRFLDPLPCLATADMTGRLLIWATRPHPNSGALLLVLRNTVITAGDTAPSTAGGLPGRGRRSRSQRKVQPIPVTSIAFRHRNPPEHTDHDEAAAAASGAKQSEPTAAKYEKKTEDSPVLDVQKGPTASRTANTPAIRALQEVGSILITGDELGSVKVWDLTDTLLDKLGPVACLGKAMEDKATIPPSSFGAASHHFIHYREGPLDGVGLQASIRFRELIDIATMLRRGEHPHDTKPEPNGDKDLHREGLSFVDGNTHDDGKRANRRPSGAGLSTGNQSASSAAEKVRDTSSISRRKQEICNDSISNKQAGSPSAEMSSREGIAPDVRNDEPRIRRRLCPKEEAEATLDATPDDIDPVASWTVHDDSITFLETISSPPSILTGSLDSSSRLVSWDGSLLGVMTDKKTRGLRTASWHFHPPPKGRSTEASARAATLEQRLKTVRHEERYPTPSLHVHGSSSPSPDVRDRGDIILSNLSSKAPANGSEFGTVSGAVDPRDTPPMPRNRAQRLPPSTTKSVDEASKEGGRIVTAADDERSPPAQSAISAVCLSRIKELTQVRIPAKASSSDNGSETLQTLEDGLEARLLSEAREGREYQPEGGAKQPPRPSTAVKREGHGKNQAYHHAPNLSKAASEYQLHPLPQKLPPNLSAEQERKHAKRTRTMLDFLSNTLSRMGDGAGPGNVFSPPSTRLRVKEVIEGPRVTEGEQGYTGHVSSRPFTSPVTRTKCSTKGMAVPFDDSEAKLQDPSRLSPASKLRHAVMMATPVLALTRVAHSSVPQTEGNGGEDEGEEEAGEIVEERANKDKDAGHRDNDQAAEEREMIPPTLKSVLTLAPTRSAANMSLTQRSTFTLASVRSNRSIRPNISTKTAVARRLAADRRRRRMECILDGVRRIGQREGAVTTCSLLPSAEGHDSKLSPMAGGETEQQEAAGEGGTAGAEGGQGGGTVVISTRVREILERSVNSDDSRDGHASSAQTDPRVRSMRRQHDAHKAARQEAIRHNERYRRAQRYDLIALQETQQRRQEAIVGLTGPSGERFGPYSLDDVLEFHAFANFLNVQGAEHLTVMRLIENPEIQKDAYSHALLQELMKSGVLQWNQPLSFEDLMRLVFLFAKHEEIKRMVALMDIVVLLERARDAFLADKSSLLSTNGSLSSHFTNDIDMTFRAAGADACGTCTVKDLHGIMTRVGSDLFSCGQDDLEGLAAQCGVVDGHTELTTVEFTAIISKLVSLHQ